jgi:phosphoserine aminotransferase
MSQRVYNFSAGPAILPVPVLEEASRGVLEINNSGMSVLEVSHRGPQYEAIHFDCQNRILNLLGLKKEDYTVLFLGGGASTQFLTIPMNFCTSPAESTVDYIHTGEWSSKAMKEAKRFAKVNIAGSSEGDKFASVPHSFNFSPNAKYVHITTNNTIEGTQFFKMPNTGSVPLVADMSSEFLSRPLDYSKFSLIYAGAQKNAGPAGVTIVVIKKSFLEQSKEDIPTMLAYKTHSKSDSLYNTPPAFAIYVVQLVCKWLESQGGLESMDQKNRKKSGLVYSALEAYPEMYDIVVKNPEERSLMNVTFRLKKPELEKAFLEGSIARHMDGLKGHRSVGGLRASIYNAFPEAGCKALADYVTEFAKKNG